MNHLLGAILSFVFSFCSLYLPSERSLVICLFVYLFRRAWSMDITSSTPMAIKFMRLLISRLLRLLLVGWFGVAHCDAAAAFNMTLFNNWSLTQLDFYNDRFSQKQMCFFFIFYVFFFSLLMIWNVELTRKGVLFGVLFCISLFHVKFKCIKWNRVGIGLFLVSFSYSFSSWCIFHSPASFFR